MSFFKKHNITLADVFLMVLGVLLELKICFGSFCSENKFCKNKQKFYFILLHLFFKFFYASSNNNMFHQIAETIQNKTSTCIGYLIFVFKILKEKQNQFFKQLLLKKYETNKVQKWSHGTINGMISNLQMEQSFQKQTTGLENQEKRIKKITKSKKKDIKFMYASLQQDSRQPITIESDDVSVMLEEHQQETKAERKEICVKFDEYRRPITIESDDVSVKFEESRQPKKTKWNDMRVNFEEHRQPVTTEQNQNFYKEESHCWPKNKFLDEYEKRKNSKREQCHPVSSENIPEENLNHSITDNEKRVQIIQMRKEIIEKLDSHQMKTLIDWFHSKKKYPKKTPLIQWPQRGVVIMTTTTNNEKIDEKTLGITMYANQIIVAEINNIQEFPNTELQTDNKKKQNCNYCEDEFKTFQAQYSLHHSSTGLQIKLEKISNVVKFADLYLSWLISRIKVLWQKLHTNQLHDFQLNYQILFLPSVIRRGRTDQFINFISKSSQKNLLKQILKKSKIEKFTDENQKKNPIQLLLMYF